MRAASVARFGLAVVLGLVIVRCAWVSDDAFITLRTLENFRLGHGLTFNPIERVQAFTHPLWAMWLGLAYLVTGEPWLTTMAVGAATTLLAVGVLMRGLDTPLQHSVALVLLLSSKAWVDYTTSGLEGPLLWLLLALFTQELGRSSPRPRALLLWTGLVGLTRLDAMLLVIPGLVHHRRRLRDLSAWVGLLPLLAWQWGAFVYYGDVVPNTARAKLLAGVPAMELWSQAPHYFGWTAIHDPVTLPVIGLGVGVGLVQGAARHRALAVGVLLYLGYLVNIGGDFMGGRFFTAPLWLSALVLSSVLRSPGPALAISAAALLASLSSPYAPLRSGPAYTRAPASHGVVDERGYYWAGTGWWTTRTQPRAPTHPFAQDGRKIRRNPPDSGVVVKSVIGLYGYYAGPDIHIVDRIALADPLLARLPADRSRDLRIGHFRRKLPPGYRDSIRGPNALAQPEIAALYDDVRTVTRGPLWTSARAAAIGRLLFSSPAPPKPVPR